MENRITRIESPVVGDDERGGEPQRIGDILGALLDQYQIRFPEARIAIVETPADSV